MKRFLVLSAAMVLAAGSALAQGQQVSPIATDTASEMTQTQVTGAALEWAYILTNYTEMSDGVVQVDYAGLKASEADYQKLSDYIDELAAMSPSTFERDKALAYWANLYNALTVKLIIDNYPVDSIRDIKSGLFSIGPWGREIITVEGEVLTLDDIEHKKMRGQYDEPRIHYMVNCASMGCPNLMQKPWSADTLEADLDAAARAFINHPRGARVEGGDLTVSRIYKWYREDFGDSEAGVISHLKQYADGDLAAALEAISDIDGHQYDWSLNAQ